MKMFIVGFLAALMLSSCGAPCTQYGYRPQSMGMSVPSVPRFYGQPMPQMMPMPQTMYPPQMAPRPYYPQMPQPCYQQGGYGGYGGSYGYRGPGFHPWPGGGGNY